MNRGGAIAVKEVSTLLQRRGLNRDLNCKGPAVCLGVHDPSQELERKFQTHRQNEVLA